MSHELLAESGIGGKRHREVVRDTNEVASLDSKAQSVATDPNCNVKLNRHVKGSVDERKAIADAAQRTIFVGNVPPDTKKSALKAVFSKCAFSICLSASHRVIVTVAGQNILKHADMDQLKLFDFGVCQLTMRAECLEPFKLKQEKSMPLEVQQMLIFNSKVRQTPGQHVLKICLCSKTITSGWTWQGQEITRLVMPIIRQRDPYSWETWHLTSRCARCICRLEPDHS